jgi:two-component system phosphate regulon sensor histidine kinase PhoR
MKNKKRLIYQLFPSYLVITLVSLFAVSWYALSFTRQFYLERTRVDLEISGRLLEKQVIRLLSPLGSAGHGSALQGCRRPDDHPGNRDSSRWPGGW